MPVRVFWFSAIASLLCGLSNGDETSKVQISLSARSGVGASTVAGDHVEIRILVTNRTGTSACFLPRLPATWLDLAVFDAAGSRVEPNSAAVNDETFKVVGGPRMAATQCVAPSEAATLTAHGQEWFDLADWGYHDLKPGSYSVEVPRDPNMHLRKVDVASRLDPLTTATATFVVGGAVHASPGSAP